MMLGGFGVLGVLLMILFWVLIVAGAVWLLGRLFPGGVSHPANSTAPKWTPPASPETPLDILKRRYASGEIAKAEYDQMRQDILSDTR